MKANIKHKIKVKIFRDDSCAGFGAYLVPSLTRDKEAKIILNIEALFHACAKEKINPKEMLIECVMHEVGHVMQEYLDANFSEKQVERLVEKYSKKYHTNQ